MKHSILFMTAALTAAVAVTPCPAQTPPPSEEYVILDDKYLNKNSRKAIEAAIQDTIAAQLAAAAAGQPVNFYSGRNIVYGMNVTYKITRNEIISEKLRGTGPYILSSTLNTKGSSGRYANGRPMISLFERYPEFAITEKNKRQLYRALFKSFSKEQICNMCHTKWDSGRGSFNAISCAGPDGRIDEVSIFFTDDPKCIYTFIPPDQYFEFEKNVKRHVRFYRNKKEVAAIMAWTSMSMRCIPFRPEQAIGRLKRIARKYMKQHSAEND